MYHSLWKSRPSSGHRVCYDWQDQPCLPVYPDVHQRRKSLPLQTQGVAILFQPPLYGREDSQRLAELEASLTTCSGSNMLFQTPFHDREIPFLTMSRPMYFHNARLLPHHPYPEAHQKRQGLLTTYREAATSESIIPHVFSFCSVIG